MFYIVANLITTNLNSRIIFSNSPTLLQLQSCCFISCLFIPRLSCLSNISLTPISWPPSWMWSIRK